MTLNDFKREAELRGNFYDNSESAAKQWARTWGFTYWRLVWFYKEYKVGNMVYRSGHWRGRHGGCKITECEINGEKVSEYRFKKALGNFAAPNITGEDIARRKAFQEELQRKILEKQEAAKKWRNELARNRRASSKKTPDPRQLSFAL